MDKPADCRKWRENFSLDKIAPLYEKYFRDVLNVYTKNGWYQDASLSLDLLSKDYS